MDASNCSACHLLDVVERLRRSGGHGYGPGRGGANRHPRGRRCSGNKHPRDCGWRGEATHTGAMTSEATPTASGDMTGTTTFNASAYKKNTIEPNATLRVSSWGDTSEQGVNKAALARFNQVYPDVKITYEPSLPI